MDAETLEALKGSIEKWEKIVSGEGADDGARNCPLCALFNSADSEFPCAGCPVMEETGLMSCDGSPYDDWCAAQTGSGSLPRAAKTDKQRRAAKAELEFLRSLLPISPQQRD